MKKRLIAFVDAEGELKNILPHGSGIDYEWEFAVNGDKVIASNGWHLMDAFGMYIGGLPFEVVITNRGEIEDIRFTDDAQKLADTELGVEVALDSCFGEDRDETSLLEKDEIVDGINECYNNLIDILWQMFEVVDRVSLGQAVRNYIAE